jgi:hypothetical protein
MDIGTRLGGLGRLVRAPVVALVAPALVAAAPAQPPATGHMVEREADAAGPTTASRNDARLDSVAEELREKRLGAPRISLFDVAWPSSTEEAEAVGRNGILQVTVVVADRAELPVRSAYIRTDAGDTQLVRLAVQDSLEPEGAPIRVVGAFREDSYYLLPMALARQPGSVLIDFAQHRSGFHLIVLPLNPPSEPAGSTPQALDRAAVRAFLKREFPVAPAPSGGP